MKELLLSGRVTDLALAAIGVEVILLLAGRLGLRPLDVLGQLLAGALLLLAVRCALEGADYRWTLAFLSASFPAHVFDLARRLRSSRVPSPGTREVMGRGGAR